LNKTEILTDIVEHDVSSEHCSIILSYVAVADLLCHCCSFRF